MNWYFGCYNNIRHCSTCTYKFSNCKTGENLEKEIFFIVLSTMSSRFGFWCNSVLCRWVNSRGGCDAVLFIDALLVHWFVTELGYRSRRISCEKIMHFQTAPVNLCYCSVNWLECSDISRRTSQTSSLTRFVMTYCREKTISAVIRMCDSI